MSDPTPDRAWVGRVLFPRSSAELRSTTVCPACFTPLTATVCASCGLDLRNPASAELAMASTSIADALDARLDIIGRIRRETAVAAVAAPAPVAATAPAAAAAGAVVAAPAPSAELPTASVAPPAVDGPRRSGIQIALIVVGISLLSVFAVFGLVYSFVTYGSDVRMAIIVAGTLATMIAAGVLARRGLTSTAEGIAALGTVMLVLDAWALRLNDPSGLGTSPETLYWGAALLVVGTTAALWSRTNRLATPGVVAAGLLPLGAGLATAHLVSEWMPTTTGADITAGAIATLATAAGSWLIVATANPAPRRAAQFVAQSVGALAAIVALSSLVALDAGARYSPAIAGLVLAAGALLHGVTVVRNENRGEAAAARRTFDTLVLGAIGAGAALATVVGSIVSAARFDQDRVIVSAPLLAATAVAVLAEQGWRRSAVGSPWRATFASATITAAALAAIAGGLAAVVAAAAFIEASTQGLNLIPLAVGDPVTSGERATVAAIGALALALGLVALGWATLGVLVRRARALTVIGGIVLIAAVPLLPTWWIVMTAYAALAVGGAVGVRLARRVTAPDARRALVWMCVPLSSGAALGAFLIGWGVPRGWAVGLVIALLAIALARPATSQVPVRAAFLVVGAAIVLGSMPELSGDLALTLPALQVSPGSVVLLGAAVILASSQLGRLAALERQAVGAVAVVAALAAAAFAQNSAIDEAVAFGLITASLALVAARGATAERLVARGLIPLAVARGAVLALESVSLTGEALDPALIAVVTLGSLIVVVTVGLLAAPGRAPHDVALAARARSMQSTIADSDFARIVGDVAAVAAGVVVVIGAGSSNASELLWLTVLTLAVLVLVTAVSRDGLIGSSSPRRFVGWVALGLATIALWMRLADAGETAPEPYVLPLAGAILLVVATSTFSCWRREQRASRSAAPLTAAALLIGLLPSAIQSVSGSVRSVEGSVEGSGARGIAVAVVAVALVIGPLLAQRRLKVALPGMSSALVGAGLTVGTVLAGAQTLDLLVIAAGNSLASSEVLRAASVVIVLSAIAVAARVLAEGRLRDTATAMAIGIAAACAGVFGLAGAIDPIELVSLPVALALLTIGTLHLTAVPAARSWPWLGPGFVALLAPSLLAIDGAGEPLWRAVALGVAAASVFVGALWRRLQAPFVIGGIVLLVHLVVQSWPLLEQVGRSVEWWLWLGLAGVLIVALAARYERRLQNVRTAARRIAELR